MKSVFETKMQRQHELSEVKHTCFAKMEKKYSLGFIILIPDCVSVGQGNGKYNIPVFMFSNIQIIRPQNT